MTWSWFGTLAVAEADARRRAIQWLYDRLGLDLRASGDLSIDQWTRVFHPNAPGSPRGPELDARIDNPGAALVYVEAKWDARLGTGRGAVKGVRDDQVALRRDSLRADPALAHDERTFVVLVVSNVEIDLAAYNEAPHQELRPVQLGWLSWSELAWCDAHPLAACFRDYLDWKREFPGGRR